MHILTYETTGSKGSAAVISSDGTIALSASSSKMDHLKDISTLASEALEKKKLSIHDISYVAAGHRAGFLYGHTHRRYYSQNSCPDDEHSMYSGSDPESNGKDGSVLPGQLFR